MANSKSSPNGPESVRSSRPVARFVSVASIAIMAAFVVDNSAWAIPSPDVMVNLFASAAQVLGLVSILLGRWFFVSRGRRAGTQGNSRTWRIAFMTAAGLFVAASVGWYLYFASVRDQNLARLQVNLTRNSREEGKKIVDVSLKELSFSDQLQREDGVTTEAFEAEMESVTPPQAFDVRESEEYEVGRIAGVPHVRFPDLFAAPEKTLDANRSVTLLCFNGNRSSELAAHFESLGYHCRFMIGGYEKWIAEDRPLELQDGYKRTDLREVPVYPNRDVLLDTPDVMTLIEKRNPVFVDVRYPGDYELAHLPGAVDIAMRKLTTEELDAAIAALPKDRPIIVPCYDKRSSFFGLVMGLRLHRAGLEYLGRYTTPDGFAVGGKDKPHVLAWKAAHAPKSLVTIASEPLKGTLAWIREHIGSLALSILLLVLAIRVLIAPLTLKSERDRRVQRRLQPRMAAEKAAYVDDPQGYAGAVSRLLRENKVKPGLNLLAAVAQLFLFTLFFSVVQQASAGSTESFLWIGALGTPDATHILPLGVAALLAAQILISAKARTRVVIATTVVACVALLALTWRLSSGVNLYLVANLTLLVTQTFVCGIVESRSATREARRRARIVRRHENASVVPLRVSHIVSGCGNKAARLGHLMGAGLPVPDGFVVRANAVEYCTGTGRYAPRHAKAILDAFRALGAERVAVRSSGLNEDGTDKSYAGVFESILDVKRDSLFEALEKVAASLAGDRVDAYSSTRETGAIVVQAMVPASWAGVLFTEHPGESGAAALEMIPGLGDDLVSGRAQPQSFRLGRLSGRVLGECATPIDVAPLFALGESVEKLFGKPQDIEWAFANGTFHLLQARDITRLSHSNGDTPDERSIREGERSRLVSLARGAQRDEVVLEQTELSEFLPQPTRFSLEFMDSLWAFDGSTHRACRALGMPYDVRPDSRPLVVGVFGTLYVDKREQASRSQRAPSSVASFRLARAADEIERAWREDFLPVELRAARLREAIDLSRLSLDELVALFAERRADFVERGYVRAEEINVAADFYLKSALRALEKKGLDAATFLAHLPVTVVHTALEALQNGDSEGFVAQFGHRAPLDYELSQPRYGEDPALVRSLSSSAGSGHAAPMQAPTLPRGRVLGLAVQRARHWQALKEEAKHHALRDLAFLRRLLVEIGVRTGLDERLFELTPAEVERLADPAFSVVRAAAIVAERIEAREALLSVQLPATLTIEDLEDLDLEKGGLIPRGMRTGAVQGIRVSGRGGVTGRARVLRHPEEIAEFRDGEILVARFTDPTWMTVFPKAAGIVTEVGGWLSHAAIQAREYGLTGIVGAMGALDAISTGELVRLNVDGTVERIDERRKEYRQRAQVQVRVVRETGMAGGRLRDVSSGGALLIVEDAKLEIGEELSLEMEDGERVGAKVVRNGIPHIYGIELERSHPE